MSKRTVGWKELASRYGKALQEENAARRAALSREALLRRRVRALRKALRDCTRENYTRWADIFLKADSALARRRAK